MIWKFTGRCWAGSLSHAPCCYRKCAVLPWLAPLWIPFPSILSQQLDQLRSLLQRGIVHRWLSCEISTSQVKAPFQLQMRSSWSHLRWGMPLRTRPCWSEADFRPSRYSTDAFSGCLDQREDRPCCLRARWRSTGWSDHSLKAAYLPSELCREF